METYIYVVTKRKNDVNGNPRSLLRVYKMVKDCPIRIIGSVNIGYRSSEQAVIEELHSHGVLSDACLNCTPYQLREEGVCNIREVSNA